ncbi:MAG: aldo/keto reductase [Ancalomicrobiaceae bacterium]|nr:aldo/keto reductase [Ancalomicrobiaceae bacterium]
MRYKTFAALPNTRLSVIGFGCWSLGGTSGWHDSDDQQSIAAVHKAIECGVTFFDTAPVYGFNGSETLLGKALKGRRGSVVLASKCGLLFDASHTIRRDLSYAAVRGDVEASLRRLQTDHLDLLQLHWPDHATPLEETARALRDLLAEGKIRAVGVSNFSLADTEAMQRLVPLSTYQGLYNLLEHNADSYHNIELEYRTEREILPYCLKNGMAFLPYSPLFQGILTGQFSAESTFAADDVRSANPNLAGATFARYIAVCEALKPIAAEAGVSLTHMALAWLCQQPAVGPVICGAQRPDQIADNAAAADVLLSAGTLKTIQEMLKRNAL